MAIDPKIRKAIEAAVEEDGQNASLSRKLVAWFEALSSSNEKIDDAELHELHAKLSYESTTLWSDSTPDGGGEQSDSDESADR